MTTNFLRTFGPLNSPVPMSYLDDNFSQLETASTSTVSITGAGLIGFLPSGTSASSTDLQTRGRILVFASDYGSKLITTPGADINQAITYVNGLAAGGTVKVNPGSYTIETTILQKSNVYLDLIGVTLTAKTGLNAPVIQNATAVTSQVITITRTNRTATATKTAHGYTNGTWVFISGANQLAYNGVHQIFNVSANTFDFYVEKTATTPATGTINVYQAVETNLRIYGGEIVGNAANTAGNNYGIYYHGVERFRIDGTYVHDTYHTCVGILSGTNGTLFDVTGNGAINSSHDGIYVGTTNAGPSGGFSYGYNIDLIGCRGDGNAQTGYELVEGRVMRMIGCTARNNGPGITVRGVSQLIITACTAEENLNHGLELFLAEGSSDISVIGNTFRYNGDAGLFCGNRDSANTCSRITLTGNGCSFNNQRPSATAAYGIAIENNVACTIDQLTLTGNICNSNARGISFGDSGTVTNTLMTGNKASGNTSDAVFGTSLDLTTLVYGLNTFANTAGNGIILPAVTTTSFSQILAKSAGKLTCPADTNLDTLATINVPANVMGANGQLDIEVDFTFTNNGNNKTMQVTFGGTTLSNVVDTTQVQSLVKIRITNDNATGAQRVMVERIDGSTLAAAATTTAIDTTALQTITIKAQKGSAGDSIIVERYTVIAKVNS